uniref:Uncharacterized protein n=1 Tax=Ditylenchus dipsaci TaxID=166011 RepID=A0A915DIB8_9BILA
MSGSSPLAGDLSLLERIRSRLRIRSDLYRCVLAEFICTAMLWQWAGTSVLAQTVLSRGRNNEYISVPVGFALPLLLPLNWVKEYLVFGTAFLCICIGMITDRRNRIDLWLQSTLIGLSLALIGTAFGYNAGFGVNPARDLGPRLFTLCVGMDGKCSVLAPLLGGILGHGFNQLAIGIHIPSEIDE